MDVHSSCEDVRVDLSDAVDSMGTYNTQVGHVDPLLSTFLNKGHTAQTIMITRKLSSNILQNLRGHEDELIGLFFAS